MLNFNLGEISERDGRQWITTQPKLMGHALYGPYEMIEQGHHVVEFEIRAADSAVIRAEEVCAVVDVVSNGGQSDVAFDLVSLGDLERGVILLSFHLDEPKVLEFRVHANGNVPLLIADRPRLISQHEPGPRSTTCMAQFPAAIQTSIKQLFLKSIFVDCQDDSLIIHFSQLPALATSMLAAFSDRRDLANSVAEAVGFRGDEENSLYRAFIGTERPYASPPAAVPFTSTLCQQAHFGLDQYRFWARALKDAPKFSRKQWEFVYIAQALHERGLLSPGKSGLVFGAGQEQLPALFASWGVRVLATDQAPAAAVEGGWAASGQHTYDIAALNKRSICTERMFTELVGYRSVDMNNIPRDLDGQFDFCWSACALEHLGSLEHGLAFVENSLRTLRRGGVAVHTTEYNVRSNEDTVESVNLSIYRRRDIEAFIARLAAQGFDVAPIDWTLGEGFAETVIDLPPFGRGEPHIRLMSGQYEVTSIGLIISKPA